MSASVISVTARVNGISTLHELHELLGIQEADTLSVGYMEPGSDFVGSKNTAKALGIRSWPEDRHWWCGVNVLDPASTSTRGKASDAIRIPALVADLDVKSSGMPSEEAAHAVINDVSAMLGSRPVAWVHTGHGLQPYWAVEEEDKDRVGDLLVCLARFGLLMKRVAAAHGGDADSTYDGARIWRVPGSMNVKEIDNPRPVVLHGDTGRPLTVGEITEALDAYGITEIDPDSLDVMSRAVVSEEWEWATSTCAYAHAMTSGWKDDADRAQRLGRHQWMLAQSTRLAAARRMGCLTEGAFRESVEELSAVFKAHCAVGTNKRMPSRGEVPSAVAWGTELVKRKTEAECWEELGDGDPHGDHAPGGHIWGEAMPGEESSSGGKQKAVSSRSWGIPTMLESGSDAEFPVDCLPSMMRKAVMETATNTMTPPDFAAQAMLAVTAGLIGSWLEIDIDGTWKNRRANLFTAIVADTGAGKTPAIAPAIRVIDAIEAEAREEWDAQKARMRRRIDELKPDAQSKDLTVSVSANEESNRLKERLKRVERRKVDDVTPERLAALMRDNDGRMVAISDEGSLLKHAMGMYSHQPNTGIYLKGKDATETFVHDRKGGDSGPESVCVVRPTLSILTAIQPVIVDKIGQREELLHQGLVGRFLWAWPRCKPRLYSERPLRLSTTATDEWVRQTINDAQFIHDNPQEIAFTNEALVEYRQWSDSLERMIHGHGKLASIKEFVPKIRDDMARIAGLFAYLNGAAAVEKTYVESAIKMGEFYLQSAFAVVGFWGVVKGLLPKVSKVMRWLVNQASDPDFDGTVTVSAINVGALGSRGKGVVVEILEVLTLFGWARPADEEVRYGQVERQVGKKSPVVELHPDFVAHATASGLTPAEK